MNTPFTNDSIPSIASIEVNLPLLKLEEASKNEPNNNAKNPDNQSDGLSLVSLSTTRDVFFVLNIIARPTIRKLIPKICPMM